MALTGTLSVLNAILMTLNGTLIRLSALNRMPITFNGTLGTLSSTPNGLNGTLSALHSTLSVLNGTLSAHSVHSMAHSAHSMAQSVLTMAHSVHSMAHSVHATTFNGTLSQSQAPVTQSEHRLPTLSILCMMNQRVVTLQQVNKHCLTHTMQTMEGPPTLNNSYSISTMEIGHFCCAVILSIQNPPPSPP